MIEEAQANLKGLSCRNILFKTGDCLEITFEENEFADRIVAINVIYFIDDLDAFFKKIYSWQRKGGCISIGVRSKECLEKIPLTKNGFIIRSTEEIMGSMLAAGFRDIKIDQKIEGERRLSDQTFEVECLVLSGHK